jgi:hypothetical protein
MNIVAALPPAHGQAAAEIRNEQRNQGVHDEYMGDGTIYNITSQLLSVLSSIGNLGSTTKSRNFMPPGETV